MKNCTNCNLLKISHMGGVKIEPLIFCFYVFFFIIFLAAFLKGYHSTQIDTPDDLNTDTSTPVEVKASLFHNRDSVNFYAERAYKLDDPMGQFVVGACYYLREQGDLPDDIYTVSHNEADSMLIFSAAQGFEPAINLIHCLHENGEWRWEY